MSEAKRSKLYKWDFPLIETPDELVSPNINWNLSPRWSSCNCFLDSAISCSVKAMASGSNPRSDAATGDSGWFSCAEVDLESELITQVGVSRIYTYKILHAGYTPISKLEEAKDFLRVVFLIQRVVRVV